MKGREKYGNKKVVVEGEVYDSKREYQRHIELLDMQHKGKISNLKRQVTFILLPKIVESTEVKLKTKVKLVERVVQRDVKYTCDFTYNDEDGKYIVEDVKISKSLLPKEYVLKKKMLRYFYGIDIKEFYGYEKKKI